MSYCVIPPFEDFSKAERSCYTIARGFCSKPVAVLNAALDAHPRALAFVLPRPFLQHRQFVAERRRVEALYGDVELVALPDGIFAASKIESALLLARDPRPPASSVLILRSTEVADRDRAEFMTSGQTTTARQRERAVCDAPRGDLWIAPLPDIWEYLKSAPRLNDYLTAHRGLEWKSSQGEAGEPATPAGLQGGVAHGATVPPVCNAGPRVSGLSDDRLRGGALHLPWDRPKLVMNAGRLSRKAWRIAVAFDTHGLLCSQQFCGLWPRHTLTEAQFLALTAVLNGPVANAFLATHSPEKGIRIYTIEQIPVPPTLPVHVETLVRDYARRCAKSGGVGADGQLDELLTLIDAACSVRTIYRRVLSKNS